MLIDYYIRYKEDHGKEAESVSSQRVAFSHQLYLDQFKRLADTLLTQTDFYKVNGITHAEAMQRVLFLKDVVENKGGDRLFYVKGEPIEREEDLQILYRMTWFATPVDVTREANDGRGPVDFKVSLGSSDKTLVEFKLAKNSQLEKNLANQAQIYEKARDAKRTIKVILYFTVQERGRAERILKKLNLTNEADIVLIDARRDNKPSGSKAG